MAFVIAVSGMSGAGKSSLVRRAVELLGDRAVALHFDEYRESSTYPADLKDWAARGADVDEWQAPRLAEDLRRLRADPSIAYVVIEEPFGNMRAEMAGLIDLAVHIDVPADVLLARRLLRRYQESPGEALVERLQSDLHHHLAHGRELDALGSRQVKAAAEVVLDGSQPVDAIAEELVSEVRRRR